MLLGVRRRAGNPQQILRRGRTQHRVDVNALFEQRLAQAAQVDSLRRMTTGTMAVSPGSTLKPRERSSSRSSCAMRSKCSAPLRLLFA